MLEEREDNMKKLSVLLLVALSSALLMTGCGKEKEPEVIEEAVVVETPSEEPETEEITDENIAEYYERLEEERIKYSQITQESNAYDRKEEE